MNKKSHKLTLNELSGSPRVRSFVLFAHFCDSMLKISLNIKRLVPSRWTFKNHQQTLKSTKIFNFRLLIGCSNIRNEFMSKHWKRNFFCEDIVWRCTNLGDDHATDEEIMKMNCLRFRISRWVIWEFIIAHKNSMNGSLKVNSICGEIKTKISAHLMPICLECRAVLTHACFVLTDTWSICTLTNAKRSTWVHRPNCKRRLTATDVRVVERVMDSLSRRCSNNCSWWVLETILLIFVINYLQPQMQRSPIPNSLQQMSPLSLVTHGGQNPHRLMGAPPVGQLPSIVPHDIEQRMLEYIKLFQAPKDIKRELNWLEMGST